MADSFSSEAYTPKRFATSARINMSKPKTTPPHHHIPTTTTSHPADPIPEEPQDIYQHETEGEFFAEGTSPPVSHSTATDSSAYSSESDAPSTPRTDPQVDDLAEKFESQSSLNNEDVQTTPQQTHKRRASTVLISQNAEDVRRILGDEFGGTKLIQKVCCGGGCGQLQELVTDISSCYEPVKVPDNDAFRSLQLKLGRLSLASELTEIVELPPQTISFAPVRRSMQEGLPQSTVDVHPPEFVTPHAPYKVYSSRIHHARELTKPGAEKRTFHFDLDVTDYPAEGGGVDFVVGGAIGVSAPNEASVVDEIFNLLLVPRSVRDRPITLKTEGGRWPTIWGDEKPRELITTRRELLTWTVDVQSYPPTKPLLRLLADYASDEAERKILMFLSSAQGQGAFCDLRTSSYVTLIQLLRAFPSSKPSLPHLLCNLPTLMPRFYSLSNDPHVSNSSKTECRLIEIAVTVHETRDWHGGIRTGVGSGFFERQARKFMAAEAAGVPTNQIDVRIPMFRGLMANPLAREFIADGPMLLIGAGVGVAPFRGFVQRRLKNANCANKVWVLQGVRDSLLDELYSGEWGVHEDEVKKVVQSRRGEGRYVQEEVRAQADLVWFIINALDGRVFVCGSSKGMGEGVEEALVDVAIDKGRLRREEAVEFWRKKKEGGQYIAETW